MSATFVVEAVALRVLSLEEAVAACVARGSGAASSRRVLSLSRRGSEPLVECTLAITPAHADVVWAPRRAVELVTRLLADRDARAHEAALLAHHASLRDPELVIPWDQAVLAYAFLERAPERSTLVVTLPEHLAPGLARGSRWETWAYAEVCDAEFGVFPPPDGLASMRRARTLQPLAEAEPHVGLSELAFSPDGTQLATVDDTGTVVVHRVADGARLHVFGADRWSASTVACTPDGRFVAQAAGHGAHARLLRWSLDGADQHGERAAPTGLFRLAFTPDGARLVAGAPDRVVVLEADTLARVAEFAPLVDDLDERSMGPLVLSRAGDRGAAAGELASGSVIECFSVEPPAALWRAESALGAALALAFAPDGRELVVAGHGAVDVLDAQTGARVRRFLEEPEGSTFALAFAPDGRSLAMGHRGGLAVWRYDDASCARFEFLAEQKPEVYCVALSPDGRWLAAATSRVVVLFEVPPG